MTEEKKLTRLQFLQLTWEEDSKIDAQNVDDEISRLPKLHSKWLNFFSDMKNRVFEAEMKYKTLYGKRTRYYNGLMTKEELTEAGWTQYQGKVPLKSELERLLETDPIMLSAEQRKFELNVCLEFAEEVVKNLRYRGQDLKTLVDWKKFLAGN